MRKLMFILAFMLMGSYTYGNDLKTENKEVKTEYLGFTNTIIKVLNDDDTCTEYHAVYYDGKLVAEFEVEVEGDNCGAVIHLLKKV